VKKRKWIGAGLALALCSTALASCSNRGDSPSSENASQAAAGQLAWSDDAAKQLQDIIAGAPANGLKPELFLKGDLPADEAERATMLTNAALRYAEALAHGYADPEKIADIYTIARPRVDVRQGLAQALQDGKLKDWFASLPPQTDEYKALSQAHLHYLKLAGNAQPQPIPDSKPIEPGSQDPRVAAVAAALQAIGYLQPASDDAAPASRRYSPGLVAAVKRVQAEFGLKPDGIIGGDTLGVLNLGSAGRARELAIAMERLRWLVRSPPSTRIDVNSASATLDFWRDGQHVDRRKVVVGEPGKETPQIQAPIVNLVANPTWTAPKSIAKDEIANKSQSWLQANNFVMKDGMYVQQPGPKNSLGLVKFDMDDEFAIYLHDTPAKALFTLPDRHRSHGCVRVQDALAFAHGLARQQGVDAQFSKGLASGDESYVKLKTKIPVRLLYHTAFWDGQYIQFRPDVYGWDGNVAAALGLVRGAPRQPYQPQGEDIGP
jgi:murein L,D-transpeptidase YcbB/YkuD